MSRFYDWFKHFKDGRTMVDDYLCSGQSPNDNPFLYSSHICNFVPLNLHFYHTVYEIMSTIESKIVVFVSIVLNM